MRILRQEPRGVDGGLNAFCAAYNLSDKVRNVLNEQDIDRPRTILSIPGELYMKAKEENGLGLTLGLAIRLKKAILDWAKGPENA
jgi:hypothetical protein